MLGGRGGRPRSSCGGERFPVVLSGAVVQKRCYLLVFFADQVCCVLIAILIFFFVELFRIPQNRLCIIYRRMHACMYTSTCNNATAACAAVVAVENLGFCFRAVFFRPFVVESIF